MILRLTVLARPDAPARTVEARASPGHTVADLADALGAGTARLRVGGERLDPSNPVGDPPLLDGAVLVLDGGPPRASLPTAPLALAVVAGPGSGRCLPLTPGQHRVGRSPVCDLALGDDGVSRTHAEVLVDRDGVRVHELGATNSSRIAGARLTGSTTLKVGQEWRLGSSTLVLLPTPRRLVRRRPTGEGTLLVSPRPVVLDDDEEVHVEYPARPSPPRRRRLPWVMLAAPLPFALLLAAFFGPRMLLFGLLSPVMLLGSVVGDRSTSRREHHDDLATWSAETERATSRLRSALALERSARLVRHPDPVTVLAAATGENDRLWERRLASTAELPVRLGLGEVASTVVVQDGSAGRRLRPPLVHAPVTLDLAAARVTGVTGPDRAGLARAALGQLLTLHSPHELQVTLVGAPGCWWTPFAQVPHVRSRVDVPASARSARHAEAEPVLAALARLVSEAAERRDDAANLPIHLLVVDEPARLRSSAALQHVLADGGSHGVLVLLTADAPSDLPHETRALVRTDDGSGRLTGSEVATTRTWPPDTVTHGWAERVGAALVPLRDATPAPGRADLPASARLLDLLDLDPLDPAQVRRRWAASRPGSLAVPIGIGHDGPAVLDLVTDGPHALLAGTTGSGKSELLQSWVASLAVHRSPEQVSLVLVDYKGGAAFAACADLPHTVGVLTDLEPHQAQRALTSLDAELLRRERLLAAAGAPDLERYTGATALPRLLIVIDEFRMLAEHQPDVLARLIRIAAVGRSLGVHLVLATQRPGGIVGPDIRANVNLRLSLRVRDKVDSDDVLGSGEAAAIPDDLPGRLLVGQGSGPPVAVQTARIGGRAETGDRPPLVVRDVGRPWPEPPAAAVVGPSDLDRLVPTLRAAAREAGLPEPHRPWVPPLPERLEAGALPEDVGAVFALLDVPEEQTRRPLAWTPGSGHWMVVGAPGSGRTTALRGIVAATSRLGDQAPQVHLVGDGSAALQGLADLPQVGSVIDVADRPTLRRLLTRLRAEVAQRQERLRAAGHADLASWPVDDPARPPHLLLGIDGWARIVARGDPGDLEDLGQEIEALVRDGGGAGLRLVVTGGRELLSGRITSLISTRLALHLPDRGDAALAGIPAGVLPERPVPGRGVALPGGHAAQVGIVDDLSAAEGVAEAPWVVAPLPTLVRPADVGRAGEPGRHEGLKRPDDDGCPEDGAGLVLGVGGPLAEPLAWSPADDSRRFLVAGPSRSGRSTAACRLASALAGLGHPTVLVAAGAVPDGPYRHLTAEDHETLLSLRQAHPDLAVVVDDADRLEGIDIEGVLREITRRVDRDHGVVVATSSTMSASSQLRGLVADVGRGRCGVLLQPAERRDGDALGVRVPPLDRVPGRGYLVRGGRAEEIQLVQADA